jgi:preprotein translocase subunit SecE
VAERNRPADDSADDRPEDDEVFVEDDADDSDEELSRGGGTATVAKAKAESEDEQTKTKKDLERVGFFGRIGRFFREVVAELRKVIWPTRKELLTYTAVVVSFLTVMTAIVVGLDYAFAKAVLWALGGSS